MAMMPRRRKRSAAIFVFRHEFKNLDIQDAFFITGDILVVAVAFSQDSVDNADDVGGLACAGAMAVDVRVS